MATTFLNDTFDEAGGSNVLMSSHSPNTGGSYTFVELTGGAGPTSGMYVAGSSAGYAGCTAGQAGVYNSAQIGSTEWDVTLTLDRISASYAPLNGLMVQVDSSGAGGYLLFIHSYADELRIYKNSVSFANAGTLAASVAHTQATGSHTYKLQRRNSGADAIIKAFVDGVEVLSHTDTSPPSSTTGLVGFRHEATAIGEGRILAISGTAELSAVDLSGAAQGQATATGAVSHGVPLTGGAAAQAAATGNLSVTHYGILTTPPLKNNAGTVLANETGATVHVYSTAGALVVTKTGQTTNASGVMVITDPALVNAVEYRVVIVLASGAEGLAKLTSS